VLSIPHFVNLYDYDDTNNKGPLLYRAFKRNDMELVHAIMAEPRFDINFNRYKAEDEDEDEEDEEDEEGEEFDLMPPLLCVACQFRNADFAKFLFDRNIDPDTQSYLGVGPLVLACEELSEKDEKTKEIFELLVDKIDARNHIGQIAHGVLFNRAPQYAGFVVCNCLGISPSDLLGNQPDDPDEMYTTDPQKLIPEIEDKLRLVRTKSARPENPNPAKKQKI